MMLAVLLISSSVWAQSSLLGGTCGSPSELLTNATDSKNAVAIAQCRQFYKDNKCDEWKAKQTDPVKSQVMDCTKPNDWPIAGQVSFGCAKGAGNFALNTLKSAYNLMLNAIDPIKGAQTALQVAKTTFVLGKAAVITMARAGEWYQQCDQDPDMRRDLLAPVAMMMTPEQVDGAVKNMQCFGIASYVETQTNNINVAIADKMQQQKTFTRENPNQPIPADLQLSKAEQIFLFRQSLSESKAMQWIWDDIQKKNACLTLTEKVAIVCDTAATLISTAFGGLEVKALEEADVIAATEATLTEALSKKAVVQAKTAATNAAAQVSTSATPTPSPTPQH